MADSIIRLKVESQEYDAKLKRASEGLTRYTDECRRVGGTLEVVEKDTLDYVRSLGRMDTASRTATGKLAEMKKAFVELSAQYKQMTDAEKASPFGKALAQSLSQLKTRIGESRSQLEGIKQEMNGGLSGALDAVAGKFGLNIKQLAGWGAALGGAKVALDVMKDAFFASEANVDEWGRIMDSSKSLYEGFLNALNTGDISGYLTRIDEIVNAARTAYNEIDRLGTLRTIQKPKVSAQMAENERMRAMIQTGRYIAPIDGRPAEPGMKSGDKLTADQIRAVEKHLKSGMETLTKLIGNEVKQTSKAIDAVYSRTAKELGMSLKEFRKGTSSMEEFDKRIAGAEKFRQWQMENSFVDQQTGRLVQPTGGSPYDSFWGWDVFRVDGDRYNELVQLILQRDQQSAQAYSMQAQAYRTINRAEGTTVRDILNGGGGSSSGFKAESISSKSLQGEPVGPTESLSELRRLLQEAQQVLTTSTDRFTSEQAEQTIRDLKAKIDLQPLALRLGVSTEEADRLKSKLDESIDSITEGLKPIELTVTTKGAEKLNDVGKETEGTWKDAAGAVGQLGSALQGLEDPSAKVAGIVMQSIANVALSFSKALAESAGPWDWIAAALAGTAAMVSTISAIHGATGYAEGGMIPGNSYSGDNQLARVNAGEIILNRAQQSNVAAALENPAQGASGGDRLPYMRIDDIYLGLVTYGRKHGLGDPVFARK